MLLADRIEQRRKRPCAGGPARRDRGKSRRFALVATDEVRQAVHAWQVTNAAVLHLALSRLPASQQPALAAAVPALEGPTQAVELLADSREC